MNPGIEQLRRLRRFGFHGERLFNQDGHLDLIHYTRDFWGVREVVLVYNAGMALAYRTRDMLDPDSPLHIADNTVEWRLHGDVVTVVNALLSLPAPDGRPDTTPRGSARLTADASRCVQLPMTSIDPNTGPSPELAATLALQRAHTGEVNKLGDRYLDGGVPTSSYLAGAFDELTDTGHTRYEQLRGSTIPITASPSRRTRC